MLVDAIKKFYFMQMRSTAMAQGPTGARAHEFTLVKIRYIHTQVSVEC